MGAARGSGISGDVHKHVFAVHAGVVAADVADVVHRAALRPDVAHHSFGVGAIESSVGILERFFIATSKHIEASGKCIGGSLIEVIFGHFVVAIVYERQTEQEVFFNMLVGFVESATFVVRLHFGFGLRDVRNTLKSLIYGFTSVGHTEHLREQEVVVSTNQIGFTEHGVQFLHIGRGEIAFFVHFKSSFKHSIGAGNGMVAAFPNAGGRVVVHTHRHVFKFEGLVVGGGIGCKIEAHAIGVGSIVVDHIVGGELARGGIIVSGVTIIEQLPQLLHSFKFNASIGHFFKEIATRRERHECDARK